MRKPFPATLPYRNWWHIVSRHHSQTASAWQVGLLSLASFLAISHLSFPLSTDSDHEQSGHWQSDVDHLSRWPTITRFVKTYVVWNAKSWYRSRFLHHENSILLFSFRARRIGDCASHRYNSCVSLLYAQTHPYTVIDINTGLLLAHTHSFTSLMYSCHTHNLSLPLQWSWSYPLLDTNLTFTYSSP